MPDSSLFGRWQMIRAEMSGETAPELVAQRTVLDLSATTYAVEFDGRTTDSGTVEFLSSPAGTILVLHGRSGANAARSIRCLYQQVGNRLRICFGLDSVAPAEFRTTVGDARYLATYRRVD